MKLLFVLISFLMIALSSTAQIVDIPDANFKAALIARNVDTNNDGEIQVSEAEFVESLIISDYNISDLTGISSFINLDTLVCDNNQLTGLDVTSLSNLVYLSCSFNQITTLNVNGLNNLRDLWCRDNLLNSIDVSDLINIEYLFCANNSITALDVSNLTNLFELNCSNNQLVSVNFANNNSLWWFSCSNNQLMSLDVSGLNSLSELDCTNNELVSLNITNCPSLQNAQFWNNSLTLFDFTGVIASDFLWVDFSNNDITTFLFPSDFELFSLYAESNQIVNLDLSNVKISIGEFSNNPLQTVNVKNGHEDDIVALGLEFNGVLNNIEFICVDENELEEVMNDSEAIQNDITVSSYCNFEPGGNYNRITGSVRLDIDSNGCNTSDSVITNMLLETNDGVNQGYVSTNQIGDYNAYIDIGDFIVTPNIENQNWFNITPNLANASFVDYNNLFTQNFCFRPNGVHQDVEILITPIVGAQPGFDAVYNIIYSNKGNQIASGNIELSYDDAVLDFVSASVVVASQTSGSLFWNYSNLNPFESRSITVTLNINSPMETPAINIDDQLDYVATINSSSTDENPEDNIFYYKDIVTGSYDPNDIICLEGDTVNPDQIGEYLHYNINFENTGTAPATFVVVKDIIDEVGYDMSSFQIMYASHPMQTRITNNTVEFIFDNINLGPNEKGNVVFKIKTNDTLIVGDSVENDAEIFFDYNFPIETNIATTSYQVLSIDEFNTDNSISVFPNPAKALVNIEASHIIESIEVYDIQGRRVSTTLNDSQVASIDISDLLGGIYFLKIKSEFGYKVERLIKN